MSTIIKPMRPQTRNYHVVMQRTTIETIIVRAEDSDHALELAQESRDAAYCVVDTEKEIIGVTEIPQAETDSEAGVD